MSMVQQGKVNTHLAIVTLSKVKMSLLYIFAKTEKFIVAFIHVNDLLIIENCEKLVADFKHEMQVMFEMLDLGLMTSSGNFV